MIPSFRIRLKEIKSHVDVSAATGMDEISVHQVVEKNPTDLSATYKNGNAFNTLHYGRQMQRLRGTRTHGDNTLILFYLFYNQSSSYCVVSDRPLWIDV